MATLFNQGTLRFTSQGGTQTSISSNITSTEFDITYGLSVAHGASPESYAIGDTIRYAVVLENTGSGTLIAVTHDDRLAPMFDERMDMNAVAEWVPGGEARQHA